MVWIIQEHRGLVFTAAVYIFRKYVIPKGAKILSPDQVRNFEEKNCRCLHLWKS